MNKLKLSYIFTLLLVLPLGGTPALAKDQKYDSDMQVVISAFKWFNEIASAKRKAFTPQDVALHFSNDAQMITNDELVCQGVKAHYDHFVSLNQHYAALHVNIDALKMVKSDDKIHLDYTIDGVNLADQNIKFQITGTMQVKDNRIVLFNETVTPIASS